MIPGLVHRRFRSFDGTEIAYQVRGEGPCVVLSNGLGGTFQAFRHLYKQLGDRYKILCWDYRGLYRSERPRDLGTLAVPHHCRDLATLLDHERVERAVLVGWSMGVQVNFEMTREFRRRVAAIVAINGTYGSPFRTVLASRLTRYVIPTLLRLMKAQSARLSKLSHRAFEWDGFLPLVKRFGLASRDIDEEVMMAVAADFRTLDWGLYSDMLRRLGEHDARDLLPSIDVPVLIITGDKDLFTPVFTAHKMNRKIPGSRLVIIPGGTHYTPLEYPAVIQVEVQGFLDQIDGWKLSTA